MADVEQRDREVAAEWMAPDGYEEDSGFRNALLSGKWDNHSFVQMLARHRQPSVGFALFPVEATDAVIKAMRGRAVIADCRTEQGARDIYSNIVHAVTRPRYLTPPSDIEHHE